MELKEAIQLKKDSESEVIKIIKSFEERTHIRVENIDMEDRSQGCIRLEMNCKL